MVYPLNACLWQEVEFGLSAVLLLGLIEFRLTLPQVSTAYSDRGWQNYAHGQLASAQAKHERALTLDPDNAEAHYYLGSLENCYMHIP